MMIVRGKPKKLGKTPAPFRSGGKFLSPQGPKMTFCRQRPSCWVTALPRRIGRGTGGNANSYRLDRTVVESQQKQESIFYQKASRHTLKPTQLPMQLVPSFISLGVKRPWRDVNYLPPSTAVVNNCSCTSSPLFILLFPFIQQVHQN